MILSIVFFPRLECWQYVKIDTLSWQKTLKKLTRLSSKKMSKSMNSTSKLQKRCLYTHFSHWFVCLLKWSLRSSDCDLHKLLENFGKIVFNFITAEQWPPLRSSTTQWLSGLFVCLFLLQFWLIKMDLTVALRHLLNLCTHLRHHFKNH